MGEDVNIEHAKLYFILRMLTDIPQVNSPVCCGSCLADPQHVVDSGKGDA